MAVFENWDATIPFYPLSAPTSKHEAHEYLSNEDEQEDDNEPLEMTLEDVYNAVGKRKIAPCSTD